VLGRWVLVGCLILAFEVLSSALVGSASNSTPITIPATGTSGVATPYPSSINAISTFQGVVKSVSVTINDFSHTFPDDVDVVLVGPNGAAVVLMSDVGGSVDAVGLDITFSDTAASALPDAGPLVSGTFRPTNVGTGDVFTAPGPASYVSPAPAGSSTMSAPFAGINLGGTWSLFVVDDVGGDIGQFATGWTLRITTVPPVLDHDTDGTTDLIVVRGGAGGAVTWFVQNAAGFTAVPWGATSDFFLSGSFDTDWKSDHVVWRPGSPSIFFVRQSINGAVLEQQWGLPTDVPIVTGDYDGDARTDFAVWRPSDGVWYIRRSTTGALLAQQWGLSTDLVAPGDYDGDGRHDFAVRRNQGGGGVYHILQSTAGYLAVPWGFFNDRSAPGDYDGDTRTDLAVVRNQGGSLFWYVRRSSDGALFAIQFGAFGDLAVPGDYDGDGRTDVAVWRPTDGTFYAWRSSNSTLFAQQFGQNFDYPVANFVVQ
jgi:subtilisin-like proprotein convertase family protein